MVRLRDMNGTLFIVATPIGNLGDSTYRAINTLSDVDIIFCEDTRITRKLLASYDINTPLRSYHQEDRGDIRRIISLLKKGENIALVCDAGTPVVSDPGSRIVNAVREEIDGKFIQVVPGASAVTAALSGSGFPASPFSFHAFPPTKNKRNLFFSSLSSIPHTIALYESPHRFLKTIHALGEHIGEERILCIAREITKVYESFIFGTVSEIEQYYAKNEKKVRGEFVILIAPREWKIRDAEGYNKSS